MQRQYCIVAFGANLHSAVGSPRDTLATAARRVSSQPGMRLHRQSGWYATRAWPHGSGPDFVNGVALYETTLVPGAVLRVLRTTETKLGRTFLGRNTPRTIDLDLIAHGHCAMPGRHEWRLLVQQGTLVFGKRRRLVLPHPEAHRRPFVLVPLAEIDERWLHPVLGARVTTLLGRCRATMIADVRRLD